MKCPLGGHKRLHKGNIAKCTRISGRENHYIGFRNSLQTFATDLSQLSLRYVMYIWNLEAM